MLLLQANSSGFCCSTCSPSPTSPSSVNAPSCCCCCDVVCPAFTPHPNVFCQHAMAASLRSKCLHYQATQLSQAFLDAVVLLCRDVGRCSDTNFAASCCVLSLPLLHVQPLCWLLHDSTQHARLVVSTYTFSALSVISPQQLSYTVHHWSLLLKKQVARCLCRLELQQAATDLLSKRCESVLLPATCRHCN